MNYLCNLLFKTEWLHFYLIPCPFKYLSGFDCPGCGFQRSVISLFQGDLKQSLHFYPATLFILTLVALIALEKFGFTIAQKRLKQIAFYSSAMIITLSYGAKLLGYQFS